MKKIKIAVISIVGILAVMITACGGKGESNETTLDKNNETESISVVGDGIIEETIIDITMDNELGVTTESTTLVADNDDIGEEITTKFEENSNQEQTTKKNETITSNQEQTTKKNEATTAKKEQTTEKKEETRIEDIPDGEIWKYDSNIYKGNAEKSRLEQIFWDNYHYAYTMTMIGEFGWTNLSKEKNDKMTRAMVELVYDIMQKYNTDIERERELYLQICKICEYDYYGSISEAQVPYDALVERKAVCGGYAYTFALGLTMMGIENKLIKGSTTEGYHAWNQVCIDGDWYQVDVTWGDEVQEGEYYYDGIDTYGYFNLTTQDMADTHEIKGVECKGGKYGQEYIKKWLIDINSKIIRDKHVIYDTKELVMEYINDQLSQGVKDIDIYVSTAEVKNEVIGLISSGSVEEGKRYKLYSIEKNSPYYYFNFKSIYDFGGDQYGGMPLGNAYITGIFHLALDVEYLSDYIKKDNYFTNYKDVGVYAREQRNKGETDVRVYMPYTIEQAWDLYLKEEIDFGEGFQGVGMWSACSSDNMIVFRITYEK